MNLGWGPSYLEFKNAGANRSKISSTLDNTITLEGTAPAQTVIVQNVADPLTDTDASNRRYVNSVAAGFVKTDGSTQQKTGLFTFANTLDSTAPSNGSLVVKGGVGIEKSVNVGGQVSADTFLVTSDVTLKESISDIVSPLEKVRSIRAAEYNLIDQETRKYGVLAQNLEENGLGSLVADLADHKAVDYTGLIGILLGAVKELDSEVRELRAQLN